MHNMKLHVAPKPQKGTPVKTEVKLKIKNKIPKQDDSTKVWDNDLLKKGEETSFSEENVKKIKKSALPKMRVR